MARPYGSLRRFKLNGTCNGASGSIVFGDRAALLYTAELRLTSSRDPLKWRVLDFFDVDWVQLVPFVDIGRVAPNWSVSDLRSDMKWSLGAGLRFMAQRAVFRFEVGTGENTWSIWMMVGHPV